jgi:hypothetical protein
MLYPAKVAPLANGIHRYKLPARRQAFRERLLNGAPILDAGNAPPHHCWTRV